MNRNWWIALGTIASGTAIYLLVRKLMKRNGRTPVPVMAFDQPEKRRFDDLNSIFDDVETDSEEPWL